MLHIQHAIAFDIAFEQRSCSQTQAGHYFIILQMISYKIIDNANKVRNTQNTMLWTFNWSTNQIDPKSFYKNSRQAATNKMIPFTWHNLYIQSCQVKTKHKTKYQKVTTNSTLCLGQVCSYIILQWPKHITAKTAHVDSPSLLSNSCRRSIFVNFNFNTWIKNFLVHL